MVYCFVIPGKRESISRSGRGQAFQTLTRSWISVFTGMTTIYEAISYSFLFTSQIDTGKNQDHCAKVFAESVSPKNMTPNKIPNMGIIKAT